MGGRTRLPDELGRRPRQPPPEEGRSRPRDSAHPHRARSRLSPGTTTSLMTLSFKARLTLVHLVAVALILVGTALTANWALSRAVLSQIIDAGILALAEAEAAAMVEKPHPPTHVHEMAPGTAAPSFARLDKFVQIVRMDGGVMARSVTLGSARLPTKPGLLTRLQEGQTVFETVEVFGEEPVWMVSLPVDAAGTRYAVQVAMSLDDAYAVLRSARLLFTGMAVSILVGVGLIGVLLTRRALRPIDRIVSRAREIREGSLRGRLPRPAQPDEIGRLDGTLHQMLRRLAAEAERRRVAVAVHPSQALSRSGRCEEGFAVLVFTNVLDNAVKFSPPGGQVVIDTAAEGAAVVAAVSGAGPGIPADEIPRVFERFYRGRVARATDSRGFGLGLAISRAVVENHGGQMSVESAVGRGATFRIRFPVAS